MTTTTKRKRKSPTPARPKRMHAALVRLDDDELEAIKAEAGYEPLATFIRRFVLEQIEQQGTKRKR